MRARRFVCAMAVMSLALSAASSAQQARDSRAEVALQAAIKIETIDGDLKTAIESYRRVVATYESNRVVAAQALAHMGRCYEKLGAAETQEARKTYQRLVQQYPDQKGLVAQARVRLAALGGSGGGTGGLVTRRVLADASDVGGVLTADGKYIRSMDQGTGDVLQFEVASGQRTRIKNRGPWGERENPVESRVFSRDGTQIAYDRFTSDGVAQLRIRNLDGSGLRALYSEKGSVQAFDWSPDTGAILALRSVAGQVNNQLVRISTADGSVRVLRSIASAWYMLTRASFSPDGQFVAFSLVNEGNPPHGEIYLMTADGHNEVAVAGHPAEDRLLEWTPDGRSLLFVSDRSGTWDVWTVRITGGKQQGEPELLKKDFGRYSSVLGFAPDGSLYYRTTTPLGRLYYGEIDLETGKVLVPPAPVTTRYNGPPSRTTWSPDGRSLLYVSFGRAVGNGNNNLTIRSTETGEERLLSTRLRQVWDICWAPDSRTLLAWGMTVEGNGLFRIDAATGGITRLADGRWAPRISQDGQIMVFMAEGGIRRRNLDTGEESAVDKVGTSSYADLSPDGREIVFQVDGAVKTVSLDGGEPRELFRSQQHHALRWTRDGRYIIAQGLDGSSGQSAASSEIWRIPAQGGKPLRLDLNVPNMESFALHPDNRRFAFSVNEGSRNELWVMENFLPKPAAAPGETSK